MSTPSSRTHVAEDILPGHPDRVADAIAEHIVDGAVAYDPDALVGVEVALFRRTVVVTGRIAAGVGDFEELIRESYIHEAVEAAGYRDRWVLRPEGRDEEGPENQAAATNELRLFLELELGELSSSERALRRFSDDQNIVVGHAAGSEATGWLPPGPFVARRLRESLTGVSAANAERLGPDGKVLVRIHEVCGAYRWDICNIAVQHAEGVGYEELHELLIPVLRWKAEQLDAALPGLGESFDPAAVRINGGGDFSCGGPHGDNGLSGKKLVVDGYGPGVPVGGGAFCGKDAHKVDRAGALRARQLAVRIVRDGHGTEATVRLGFLPGCESPSFVDALVDRATWDRARLERLVAVPDLSLAGTFQELELAEVEWGEVLRAGYFGNGWNWER